MSSLWITLSARVPSAGRLSGSPDSGRHGKKGETNIDNLSGKGGDTDGDKAAIQADLLPRALAYLETGSVDAYCLGLSAVGNALAI